MLTTGHANHHRLLIIENDLPASFRMFGEAAGYEVHTVSGGLPNSLKALEWQPTVIMLDLDIPDTDGPRLLRALARQTRGVQAIVSSRSDPAKANAAVRFGQALGLKIRAIEKPVNIDDLVYLLGEAKMISGREIVDTHRRAITKNNKDALGKVPIDTWLFHDSKMVCARTSPTLSKAIRRKKTSVRIIV